MTYYIEPANAFSGFVDTYEPGLTMMSNLIRFCGYKTLHPDCWLYCWLQEQIKYFKFSGEEEFKKWCTWPKYYEFFQKMDPRLMKVTYDQMQNWRNFLEEHGDLIANHCQGAAWKRYYRPATPPHFTFPAPDATARRSGSR